MILERSPRQPDLFGLFEPLDEPRYPERVGYKEPTTSADAARFIAPRVTGLRKQCLAHLRSHGPRTADETAAELGISLLSIRPRFSELRSMGLIRETGERRDNESGTPAMVWRATPPR